MKKVIVTMALLMLLGSMAVADTLYLKNGSVLKGTFVGYENGEFIFEVGGGGRVKFPPGEVSRLVIERDISISGNSNGNSSGSGNSGGINRGDSDRSDSTPPVLARRGSELRSPESDDSGRSDSARSSEPERRAPERPDRSGRVLSRGGGSESSQTVEVRLEGEWVRS